MRFLIDENVPASVSQYLANRGHQIIHALELFLPGEKDEVLAVAGDQEEAVIVTWNRQDFNKITARRAPVRSRKRLRKLGWLFFKCPEPQGLIRLQQTIDLIEFEHERAQQLKDSRVGVEICRNFIKIYR